MDSPARRNRSRETMALLGAVLTLLQPRGASAVTLSCDDTQASPGDTVTVSISLDNDVSVRALQLQLTGTPNGAAVFVSGSARMTARSSGFAADANDQGDGSVVAILNSTGAALIAAASGPVMQLDFSIDPAASPEVITLDLSDAEATDADQNPLAVVTQGCHIVVELSTATPSETATPTMIPTGHGDRQRHRDVHVDRNTATLGNTYTDAQPDCNHNEHCKAHFHRYPGPDTNAHAIAYDHADAHSDQGPHARRMRR